MIEVNSMIKAQHDKLLQEANQQILEIRNMEISYYSECFNNFSTQSALIAGFVLQSLTNLNLAQAQKSRVVTWASVFYWISVAVLTATSMHCILCASICNIYAPGLALRGPTGSMVRAVEGMIEEQLHIVRAFMWSIGSFAVAIVMFCWMTMTVDAAIGCTVVMVIASYFWYSHCTSIYNKFKWKDTEVSFSQDKNANFIFKYNDIRELLDFEGIWKEGYFCRKDISSGKFINNDDDSGDKRAYVEWQCKYVVMQGRYMMFFNSREEFEDDVNKVMTRPINLTGYGVSELDEFNLVMKLTPINTDDDRREWEFKFDTVHLLEDWANAIHRQVTAYST